MLALRIALRYLFAKKSHRAVNVISVISLAGVAVATMAIVVVLSVFNGFSDLAHTRLGRIDPDFKAVVKVGKVFAGADSVAVALSGIEGVAWASPTLQERALLVAGDAQMPVRVTGSDPGTYGAPDLSPVIIDGAYATEAHVGADTLAAAQLSVGVALHTGLRPGGMSTAVLYAPRRVGRINPANPAAAYRQLPVVVSAVFQIDQPEYDNDCVTVPLDSLRRLLEYRAGEASAIDIGLEPGADAARVASDIGAMLGDGFDVLSRERQQADTFRMISVEKWITFLMLVFILVVASFNIVSTLSLMVIEKRYDMATLRSLGASRSTVRRVFIAEGWLITAVGGLVGIALGVGLSLLQERFGLIRLDGDPAALSVEAYPVRLEWGDVGMVLATVVVVGFAIAQLSRLFTRKID